jgi:putative nucleotidyltransferase with HDIG domain
MVQSPERLPMTTREAGDKAIGTAIERAKQELERMIDLCPQIMLLAGRDGTLLRANRAVLALIGQPDIRKLRGQTLDSLLKPQTPDFFRKMLGSLDGFREKDVRIEPPGCAARILRVAAVSTEAGDTIAVQARDLTAVAASGETAREQREVVEAVVGGLMHHLNQPLTVLTLRGYLMETELNREKPDLDLLRSHLRDVINMTMFVADIIRNAEHPEKVATAPYVGDTRILDLAGSSGEAALTASCVPVLNALTQALDERMPGYAGHALRTAGFAERLATRIGIEGQDLEVVRRAALAHDVGKIGVPDAILLKPGHLSIEETDIMRRHVGIGTRIVSSLGFLKEEAVAVAAHHERFDGKGYPEGLAGEAIPRAARVVAVADAFDAMRGTRAYRNGIPAAQVVEQILEESGRQFDPEVVTALGRCWQELDAVSDG